MLKILRNCVIVLPIAIYLSAILRLVHTVRFYRNVNAIFTCDFIPWNGLYGFMKVFTWHNLSCIRCFSVCDVAHEQIPYPFCAIVMCDSNINTLQIASTPKELYEQFHKIACKKVLSHAEQIVPCERAFN